MIGKGLSQGGAATHPDHPDERLRGRSYAIPFERVWTGALLVAEEEVEGWSVQRWDDRAGTIFVEAHVQFLRRTDDVKIHVSLDPNGQTRVDVESEARQGKIDLGRNARRIGEFLTLLDRTTEAQADQILPREYARTVVTGPVPAT